MSKLQRISRREFLKRTGQASGGLIFALSFTTACSRKGPLPGIAARRIGGAERIRERAQGRHR